MKRTDLFIFLDILFATLMVVFVGTLPLAASSNFIYALLVHTFKVFLFAAELFQATLKRLNFAHAKYIESIIPRKISIQVLDPLII